MQAVTEADQGAVGEQDAADPHRQGRPGRAAEEGWREAREPQGEPGAGNEGDEPSADAVELPRPRVVGLQGPVGVRLRRAAGALDAPGAVPGEGLDPVRAQGQAVVGPGPARSSCLLYTSPSPRD